MAAEDRDRDAERLGKRNWTSISAAWADYVPIFEEGIRWPEEEVENLPSLRPVYEYLRQKPQGETQEVYDIDFLYPEVFLASLAYVRRGVHVLRSAVKHSESGYRSWSRVSAYQAAFFGMQAILRLLGAVILYDRAREQTFQLDLWAETARSTRRATSAADCFSVTGFLRCKRFLRHYHFWSMFSRLLRATSMPPNVWPYIIADRYKLVAGDSYAELRNKLDYRASFWPYDDLTTRLPAEDLQAACHAAATQNWTDDPSDGRFPFFLGLQIVPMALMLFKSVAGSNSRLSEELDLRIQDLNSAGADIGAALTLS